MSDAEREPSERQLQELSDTQDAQVHAVAKFIDRRSLFKIAAAIASSPFTYSFATALAANVSANYWSRLASEADKLREKAALDRDAAEKLHRERRGMFFHSILGGEGNVAFIPSRDNPYSVIKGITEPSRVAIDASIDLLRIPTSNIQDGNGIVADMWGHILMYGGPLANFYSRQILGTRGFSPLLKLVNANLPCHFANILEKDCTLAAKPIFRLHINNKTFTPTPTNDVLLLTRIPNVFSRNYAVADESLLILAGVHGAGTRAVKTLLSDKENLGRLEARLSSRPRGWQIPISVQGLSNGEVRLHFPADAFPISADFDRLHQLVEGVRFWVDRSDPCFAKTRH